MKKRTKRLCLFVVILILVSSFIGDNQIYAATKLKNGKYTTCHYAKRKTSYNGSACMYKAKIKGNKLIIWGGLDKIDNDWNILSTKSYKKRIFTVKKIVKFMMDRIIHMRLETIKTRNFQKKTLIMLLIISK